MYLVVTFRKKVENEAEAKQIVETIKAKLADQKDIVLMASTNSRIEPEEGCCD